MTRPWHWLSTLRPGHCWMGRKTRFRRWARPYRVGLMTHRVTLKGFQEEPLPLFPLSQALPGAMTLYRPGQEDIILVTDLTDAATYPAVDLLELYLARWGIERVFQVITEVFSLQRLVGTTPQGTLFQLGFCLLLYNMIQVVRTYVAAGAGDKPDAVSTELLYVDVQRQLIALHEMLEPEQIVSQFVPVYEAQQLQDRLRELLEPTWTERWRKAKPKKRSPPKAKGGKREHTSAYRVLQEYRLAKKEPPGSKRP